MLALVVAALASPAVALDTNKAQGDMHTRIEKEVSALQEKLGAPQEIRAYCVTEMDLKLDNLREGGRPVFAVNYHEIKTQEHLDLVIFNRESYEKTFVKLCLINTMKTLTGN